MHIFRRHLPWADNDSFADVLLAYPEIFLVHGPRGRRMARLRALNDHYSRCDRETTCTCAYNICWQLHNSDETGSEEGEKGERRESVQDFLRGMDLPGEEDDVEKGIEDMEFIDHVVSCLEEKEVVLPLSCDSEVDDMILKMWEDE